MTSFYLISVVRTLAGYAVGAALSLPIAPALEQAAGVNETTARTGLTAGLVFVIGTGYYAAVRRLEQRWPGLGRFLAIASPPAYPPPPASIADTAPAIAAAAGLSQVVDEP